MHVFTPSPRRWPALALVLLSLAPAVGAQGGNLLVNGGAESGTLAPWIDAMGTGFEVVSATDLDYVGVTDGGFHFWAGDATAGAPVDHDVFQDVDLSTWAADIDAGLAQWCASAFVYSRREAGSKSEGRIRLELYDGQGGLLTLWDSGPTPGFNSYFLRESSASVPVGSRTARFRMLAHRFVGDATDAAFDQCTLNLVLPPAVYCTSQVNSQGCLPAITFSGTPSTTAPTPFLVGATGVINDKTGLLFFGPGEASTPLFGGTLCVASPITRTAAQSSGGNPPPDDCSGTFSIDFNLVIQAAPPLTLEPCQSVYAQYWSRDPASPSGVHLTDALRFTIEP